MIERASANFISERNVKGHTIDGVFMTLKGMYEVSSGGIPEFTGTIIAAGEELIAVLIETAVGKGEYMAFEFFDKGELLLFFVLDFLDEF